MITLEKLHDRALHAISAAEWKGIADSQRRRRPQTHLMRIYGLPAGTFRTIIGVLRFRAVDHMCWKAMQLTCGSIRLPGVING